MLAPPPGLKGHALLAASELYMLVIYFIVSNGDKPRGEIKSITRYSTPSTLASECWSNV
uniref:Uncharacterized protein n=1 Tax=Anguilla anguilla TaxID=7936 RepID=A0A0E9R1K5_ANGAN